MNTPGLNSQLLTLNSARLQCGPQGRQDCKRLRERNVSDDGVFKCKTPNTDISYSHARQTERDDYVRCARLKKKQRWWTTPRSPTFFLDDPRQLLVALVFLDPIQELGLAGHGGRGTRRGTCRPHQRRHVVVVVHHPVVGVGHVLVDDHERAAQRRVVRVETRRLRGHVSGLLVVVLQRRQVHVVYDRVSSHLRRAGSSNRLIAAQPLRRVLLDGRSPRQLARAAAGNPFAVTTYYYYY